MKHWMIAASLAAAAATALADGDITAVSCGSEVTGCAFAADGNFPAPGQQWQTDTAWWSTLGGAVVYSLTPNLLLSSLVVSLDNNDDYQLSTSTDGNTWAPLITVTAAMGSVGWGMDSFDSTTTPGLAFTPVVASFLRIAALGGDNAYSVGELTVSAVPEPATWALMAGAVAALALRRARR